LRKSSCCSRARRTSNSICSLRSLVFTFSARYCDTDSARVALPQVALPEKRFVHPEDARQQLEKAVQFNTERFGLKPKGMWPSEGSVCQGIVSTVAEAGTPVRMRVLCGVPGERPQLPSATGIWKREKVALSA